jgi:hypothetical protein
MHVDSFYKPSDIDILNQYEQKIINLKWKSLYRTLFYRFFYV